jgi:hypothetical protein
MDASMGIVAGVKQLPPSTMRRARLEQLLHPYDRDDGRATALIRVVPAMALICVGSTPELIYNDTSPQNNAIRHDRPRHGWNDLATTSSLPIFDLHALKEGIIGKIDRDEDEIEGLCGRGDLSIRERRCLACMGQARPLGCVPLSRSLVVWEYRH